MSKKPRSSPVSPTRDPAATRARHAGWAPDKQLRFIDALAASGCVAEACGAVGISRQAAYALRTRPAAQAFRMAWDAALDLAIRRLADECFSRAMQGVAVPHFYQGEQVGEHRRYDNRLAMFLLRYRDPLRYAATLDQMVYDGHPEAAASAFAKAQNRLHAEAHDAGPLTEDELEADKDAGCPPWRTTERTVEEKRRTEQALAEGTDKIYGSGARQGRIQQMRNRHRTRAEIEERARARAAAAERQMCEVEARVGPPPDMPGSHFGG